MTCTPDGVALALIAVTSSSIRVLMFALVLVVVVLVVGVVAMIWSRTFGVSAPRITFARVRSNHPALRGIDPSAGRAGD